MKDQQFDAIVVGSGPGGASVAKELSAGGKKVLILEWGNNAPIRASKIQMFFMAGIPGKSLLMAGGLPVVRGITTGGSSIFYYATAFDPPLEMFNKYGIDISKEVEEIKNEIPMAPLKDELTGPMAKRIMASAVDLGYDWQKQPKFIYQDDCKAECWRCVYGCPYGAKWNARMHVDEALGNGATLINKAKVTRVIVEGGRAVGVEYTRRGKELTAYADKIILSAGGIGSPVILRASGIKGAGYDFFVDPLVSVMGTVSDIKGGKEIPMTSGVHLEDEDLLLTDFTVSKAMFMGFHVPVFKFGKMFSHSKTLQVMVKIKDQLGGMLNDDGGIRKLLTVEDVKKIDNGIEKAKEIITHAGAKEVYTAMAMAGHPGGTAKVNEIVDSNLKTEYDNLYVCDCSVIPEAWGLPPTIALVSLGKRLAKHLS